MDLLRLGPEQVQLASPQAWVPPSALGRQTGLLQQARASALALVRSLEQAPSSAQVPRTDRPQPLAASALEALEPVELALARPSALARRKDLPQPVASSVPASALA